MRGGCARRSNNLHCSCLATCPGTSRAQRLSMGSPALRWCAWMRRTMCRPLSGRGRVECRHRGPGPSDLRLRPCQPFRSRVLLAADLWAGGLEAAPRDLGHRGGVATRRHNETIGGYERPRFVVKSNQRSGLSSCLRLSRAVTSKPSLATRSYGGAAARQRRGPQRADFAR
jgi:hypothetical protein